jgi:mono/diheme cytochrome c family protein
MSGISQSHGDRGTERQRDRETEGQRDREANHLASAPPHPSIPLSLRLSILLWLRGFVAIALILFAVACRRDMQDQPKYKPLAASRFFSDGKSARQLVEGTEPFQPGDQAISQTADESKATALPFALTPQALDRGQERFNIYCSPCHGRLGNGDGMVVRRGFLAPPSYHIDRLRRAPVGHFYDVMTNGFGAMSSYADKVAPQDRWAVAAYIRALQLSQHATVDDAPPEDRAKLQSGGQKQ